jgi:hypothetical protein
LKGYEGKNNIFACACNMNIYIFDYQGNILKVFKEYKSREIIHMLYNSSLNLLIYTCKHSSKQENMLIALDLNSKHNFTCSTIYTFSSTINQIQIRRNLFGEDTIIVCCDLPSKENSSTTNTSESSSVNLKKKFRKILEIILEKRKKRKNIMKSLEIDQKNVHIFSFINSISSMPIQKNKFHLLSFKPEEMKSVYKVNVLNDFGNNYLALNGSCKYIYIYKIVESTDGESKTFSQILLFKLEVMYRGKSYSNQAYNKIFNVAYLSSFDKLTLAIITDNKVCSIFEFFELNEFLDKGEKKYLYMNTTNHNEEKMVLQLEEENLKKEVVDQEKETGNKEIKKEKTSEQIHKEIFNIKKSYWDSKLIRANNQK